MINLIINLGLLNMLGGRGKDILSERKIYVFGKHIFTLDSRSIFRFILMPLCISAYAYSHYSFYEWLWILLVVNIGIPLWSAPKIGPSFFDFRRMTKRGLYAYPMYIGLAFINPMALVYGLSCLLQGACYTIPRIHESRQFVLYGELFTGLIMGATMVAIL